ncbi:MAG: SAM-dependent methyltransferase, partial [Dehalococcoidia bacterium]
MTIHPSRDEFASITESTPLVDELHARIARHGPITFREFMDAALYHPRYGYYMAGAEVTTRAGDYVTSPEVHPVFGTLVAKQIIELWRALDRPATFTVVEAGAGRGALARDVLVRAAREPDFGDALRYRIWERSPRAQATQHETLSEAAMDHYVEWSADSPRDIVGCILTNELIDAFPV